MILDMFDSLELADVSCGDVLQNTAFKRADQISTQKINAFASENKLDLVKNRVKERF